MYLNCYVHSAVNRENAQWLSFKNQRRVCGVDNNYDCMLVRKFDDLAIEILGGYLTGRIVGVVYYRRVLPFR